MCSTSKKHLIYIKWEIIVLREIAMDKEQEIVFAAWIANLDRFHGKSSEAFVEIISGLLEQYLDIAFLKRICKKETAEWKIVDFAKQLSLCESEKTANQNKQKNLVSVFSRISANDHDSVKRCFYSLCEEGVGNIFPQEYTDGRDCRQLAKAFMEELKELAYAPPATWEHFILSFDVLLRKYAWCITASDFEGEDISLYNQSRIAAAIAACLCRCGTDARDAFKLIVGDFSGIQKYVFSVANVNEAGVAKRLRARSFFVDVVVSTVAYSVIERFQLSINHILLLTGAKFYILLPNVPDAEKFLQGLARETEEALFYSFKGQISINLAWVTIGAAGLENYSRTVVDLMQQLRLKKNRAFSHCLIGENGWNESRFIIYDDLAGKKICNSCGAELTDKTSLYCTYCRDQTEIGTKLPSNNCILYYRCPKPNSYHVYGSYWIALEKVDSLMKKYDELKKDKDLILIERLNGSGMEKRLRGLPVMNRYMANHVPHADNGEVLTFEDIAAKAAGESKLAVLKADVDNLGYIFANGLYKKKRHYGTISRVNTMSRLLEAFFSGYIHKLLKKDVRYKNVYSVFSGGDDLFLIGPWNIMADLASHIQMQFYQFAAQNAALTLSATVSIFHFKEHITNQAEISESSLKRVKNMPIMHLYPEKEGRNGVSFMGQLFSWDDFTRQMENGKRLAKLLQSGSLDTGILQRIVGYSKMYRDFWLCGNVDGLRYAPLFFYDQQRNYQQMYKKRKYDKDMEWFLEYTKKMLQDSEDTEHVEKNLYFAEIAVTYAMNSTKEQRRNGKY